MNFILILLSIAFFTLLERKILSYSQIRKGPNKLMINGLIQPIIDGLKLLKKSSIINIKLHSYLFKSISISIIVISLMMWILIPFNMWSNKILTLLFYLIMFGLSSFMILMLGWSSISKYSMMGGNRSLAQILSFDMIISILIMLPFFIKLKFSWKINDVFSMNLSFMLILMFFIIILLETHRAPFDLSEGESELVSGYNTEFSSLFFVVVFLSEYCSIIFMLFSMMMLMFMMSLINTLVLMLMVLLVRSCYPRMRYDYLMYFIWIKVLPTVLTYWFLLIMLKM